MTQGIIIFAYNTEQIDYVQIATAAASQASRFLKLPVSLVTDEASLEWATQSSYRSLFESVFDQAILTDFDHPRNPRTHWDSPYHHFTTEFKNNNKDRVINYTPYDQTLLIDSDYMICSDQLKYLFDQPSAVSLFKDAESLIGAKPPLTHQYLHERGIKHYWSTVIYFDRRQEFSHLFFDTWAHVKDNWDFYQYLYGFPGHLFRTDYCVSVATHMFMNSPSLTHIPWNMVNMSSHDDIVKIHSPNDWVYLVNDPKEQWKDTLVRLRSQDVHVMNKRSIERQFAKIAGMK